jgi:hypothetical protein
MFWIFTHPASLFWIHTLSSQFYTWNFLVLHIPLLNLHMVRPILHVKCSGFTHPLHIPLLNLHMVRPILHVKCSGFTHPSSEFTHGQTNFTRQIFWFYTSVFWIYTWSDKFYTWNFLVLHIRLLNLHMVRPIFLHMKFSGFTHPSSEFTHSWSDQFYTSNLQICTHQSSKFTHCRLANFKHQIWF